jgi:hypothetical protein
VPIDPRYCTEFDPFSVPTINELIDNLKSIDPYVKLFEVSETNQNQTHKEGSEKLDFMSMEW